MALSIELEQVNGASIDELPTFKRYIRRGVIKGVNTTGLPPEEVLVACTSVLPAYREELFPGAGLFLSRRLCEGVRGNPKKVDVTLIYESPNGFETWVTFILSRESTMIDTTTELDPKTKEPLVVTWADPSNPARVIARTVRMRYRVPFQRLIATGFYEDEPPPAMTSALRAVNSATWRGLPRGYWFYAAQADSTRNYGRNYTVNLVFETKIIEDWSEYLTLTNPNGQYVKIDPAKVATLVAKQYEYGRRSAGFGAGIIRVGPYPTLNFNSTFGADLGIGT